MAVLVLGIYFIALARIQRSRIPKFFFFFFFLPPSNRFICNDAGAVCREDQSSPASQVTWPGDKPGLMGAGRERGLILSGGQGARPKRRRCSCLHGLEGGSPGRNCWASPPHSDVSASHPPTHTLPHMLLIWAEFWKQALQTEDLFGFGCSWSFTLWMWPAAPAVPISVERPPCTQPEAA